MLRSVNIIRYLIADGGCYSASGVIALNSALQADIIETQRTCCNEFAMTPRHSSNRIFIIMFLTNALSPLEIDSYKQIQSSRASFKLGKLLGSRVLQYAGLFSWLWKGH